MNRFRNRKKAAPEPLSSSSEPMLSFFSSQQPSPQQDSPPGGLKKSATRRWKRDKKVVEEEKPDLNVAEALPSNDDFRTSLLMPNLSARFSMLRDQDDPNSLMGKASDDSVLQPRRRSRMDLSNRLGDIAEVSSIRSNVRPPFAEARQDSFASEDADGSENDPSQDGGMMSRARPGEGNTLFGGRQKVYMIPNAGTSSTRSVGKLRYEDDIEPSPYQKLKREREQAALEGRPSDESQIFDFGLDPSGSGDHDYRDAPAPNDSAKDLSHSPSASSSDQKRSTYSTSHSDARSSTAATSVASMGTGNTPAAASSPIAPPPLAPSTLKRQDTKGRRLYEQGLDQHMYEQQTSALTRLNSIQRQRTFTGSKPSGPSLQSTRSAGNLHDKARQHVYAVRSQSPDVSSPMFNNLRSKPSSGTSSPNLSGQVSPLTPHGMDMDEGRALNQALEPADRGKATALGAFNKPKHSFDEQQYLERQRQLQRSASSAANNRKEPVAPSTVMQRLGRFDAERDRSDSESARSRSRSVPKKHEPSNAYNVFQKAAQKNTNTGAQQLDKPALPDTHRTFFGNISASESEEEDEETSRQNQHGFKSSDNYSAQHGRWQPSVLPSVSEHPALRPKKSKASLAEEDEDAVLPALQEAVSSSSQQDTAPVPPIEQEDYLDSPTLPRATTASSNTNSTTLNGLMQHLRQKSNVSATSVNQPEADDAPESPELVNRPIQRTRELEPQSRSANTHSNPWDLDEIDTMPGAEGRDSGASASSPYDSRAPSSTTFPDRQSSVSEGEPESEGDGNWQKELQKSHARGASTATQQEREDFEKELAARRNAIQESMKLNNNQSRDVSPAPTSRSAGRGPTKAMKMLGITAASSTGSSGTLHSQYESSGNSFESGRRSRANSASKQPPPPPVLNNMPRALQQNGRDWQQARSRDGSESKSSSATSRSRADSEATTASRNNTVALPDSSSMFPRELTPRQSPDVFQGQFESGRNRSNSRPMMTNYFDQKNMQPAQAGQRERMNTGGASPVILSPNVYNPGPSSTRTVPPGASPFSQNMTPPLSGNSTPVSSPFSPPTSAPPSANGRPGGILRKKTVSKSDISEPTLISSTSNVDTVDLPEGASLKNGMDEPPPLPPINPRRRATKALLGHLGGRKEETATDTNGRSKTPDPWNGRSAVEPEYTTGSLSGSETRSPRIKQSFDQSPAMRQHAFPPSNPSSPERLCRSPPPPVTMEGGMF